MQEVNYEVSFSSREIINIAKVILDMCKDADVVKYINDYERHFIETSKTN